MNASEIASHFPYPLYNTTEHDQVSASHWFVTRVVLVEQG